MLIAVDIGGTKTLVAGFDTDGQPGEHFRFPTPRNTDAYIKALLRTLEDHYNLSTVTGISIAVPGIVEDNIAIWCGNLCWRNFDIASAIKRHMNVPVWVENDANLAGLAQAHALDPMPEKCLYLTVSTGIGTGYIYNGRIDPQLSNSEGGRMILEYDGRLQQWESFSSGKALYETYGRLARDIHDTDVWQEFADKLSRGLLALIPLTQPEVIVIGGSLGTYLERYQPHVEKQLRAHLTEHIVFPRIVQAFHPEEAVIYGCYQYATENPNATH